MIEVILLLGLFIIPTAYLVTLVVYCCAKFKYRTSIALVQSGEELPRENAEHIVILTGFRYHRLMTYLRFLAVVYGAMAADSLAVIMEWSGGAGRHSSGFVLFSLITLVSLFMLAGSLIRMKTMQNDIDRFLDENRFETYDPSFVAQELRRHRENEKNRRKPGNESSFERIINNSVVDRILPRKYSQNRLLRKVTGKIIKEIIVKIAVTALLIILGIKTLR